MALLIDICSDLYSSIFSYWYIWIYATGMLTFYFHRRYNELQLSKKDKANLLREKTADAASLNPLFSSERNSQAGAFNQGVTAAETDGNAYACDETNAGFDFSAQACASAAHWQRLSDIVDAATTRNDMIDRLQSKTSTHLGAAELRFNELLSELGEVMALPVRPSTPGARLASLVRTQNIAATEAIAA